MNETKQDITIIDTDLPEGMEPIHYNFKKIDLEGADGETIENYFGIELLSTDFKGLIYGYGKVSIVDQETGEPVDPSKDADEVNPILNFVVHPFNLDDIDVTPEQIQSPEFYGVSGRVLTDILLNSEAEIDV